MYWKVTEFVILILIVLIVTKKPWMVKCQSISDNQPLSCDNPTAGLFENITVVPFVDENRYIRLNISWKKPKASFSTFEMVIDTNCSALYGERNIPVDQMYVIQPNMERLKHPAEPLLHGCEYDFEIYTEVQLGNQRCMISEVLDYEIPECVGEICECGITNSPYEYSDFTLVKDHIYTLRFNKTDGFTDINLETVFDKIWYTNTMSNKTVTLVQPEQVSFDNANSGMTLPFYDFHEGNSYFVNIDLFLDNCGYHFTTKISVPKNLSKQRLSLAGHRYLIYLAIVFIACISIALTLLRAKPQFLEKLRRFLHLTQDTLPVVYNAEPSGVVARPTKEVVNSQYTPLEFIVNSHKFDQFEIPRNRVVFQEEIGGGAFGKVFRAELHEMGHKSGYILVAAKKPIESAPAEEIADFLGEIETMKKIAHAGGHPNVVKIIACVTIESPYLMVMELVPFGSLKSYLSNLRREWEERKQKLKAQHFFPDCNKQSNMKSVCWYKLQRQDTMVVENYLPIPNVSESSGTEKLKYSDLAFSDYTGSTHSSESNSYITPDTPRTPTTPETPSLVRHKRLSARRYSKTTLPKFAGKIVPTCLPSYSPMTPTSTSSSGLPSVTETLLTPLDSEPATPLIDLSEDIGAKLRPALDNEELQNFALQIAHGMAFLESLEITHRDLAARNILISEDKILKISDFGMARSGVYVNTAQKRQPLRWMAPEAIESRRCDNKTDVWSFGVVLWEIGSLGAFPYKDMRNEGVIAHILQGRRLERPETCTDQAYELMQQCWRKNPSERPTFDDITRQLESSNEKIYVDFSKISPKYVFPPIQEEIR